MDNRPRTIIIHPDLARSDSRRPALSCLREAEALASVMEVRIIYSEAISLTRIHPATLIGGGVIGRFKPYIASERIDLVVVNTALSPVHQRNLETAWQCKILDRTALILEIFGARARTQEGRLQVTLAALSFQKSRLVRSWTHLERQRGGAGFMGGPGERQIESDRRAIDTRIGRLHKRLNHVMARRSLQRHRRQQREYPIVALVGYTNAGKSTLFNQLTHSQVEAKDQLFATLDPTMRSLRLPSGMRAVLSDTVGFIADLPTNLIAAFRATLEEVTRADLLLHVRDISHPDTQAQRHDVMDVLETLEEEADQMPPLLEVHNKIDQSPEYRNPNTREEKTNLPAFVSVSAKTGEGMADLKRAIETYLGRNDIQIDLRVDARDGELLAWIHRHGRVFQRHNAEEAVTFDALFSPSALGRLRQIFIGRFIEQPGRKKAVKASF